MTWMLYGANGFTGRLVAELAVSRGQRPVLAGRDAEKVAPLATPLGLSYRTFDLADPAGVEVGLRGIDVVAHCAGPFSATSAPMIDGCLRAGVHYLDITGEIDVFEAVFARVEQARQAGIVLLPGAGFDVVPTDCLASMVAAELPDASWLELAFSVRGGISGGTLKSALEGAKFGGRARVDGQLRTVPLDWRRRKVPFPSATRQVTSLPWGDVSTAYRSTGVGTITAFADLPGLDKFGSRASGVAQRVLRLPLVQRVGKAVIEALVSGPSSSRRANSRVEVYAEAGTPSGTAVSAALTGPDTYDFTADSVLCAVAEMETNRVAPGVHTPSTAFGADFVRRVYGIEVTGPQRVAERPG